MSHTNTHIFHLAITFVGNACSPPDNHAVDFPATYDIDPGNTVHGNAAAGSTRLGFQFAGERCLEDNQSPTGEEEVRIVAKC